MTEPTLTIQLIALALFGACLYHSWTTEGRRAAQQWFLVGYLFALLLINLLVVTGQIAYNSAMLVIGAAPSLTIMLFPAVFYLAYTVAKAFVEATNLRAMGLMLFLLTAALLLPLDVTALNLGWWSFPTESSSFLNGIPFYLPLAWGSAGAAFYLMVGRIRKIRFRGNGQLFAMIIAVPLVAGLALALVALIQVVVNTLGVFGEAPLYALVALLYLGLPLGYGLRFLRHGKPARPAP